MYCWMFLIYEIIDSLAPVLDKGPSFHSRQIPSDLIFHLSVNVGLFTLTLKLIQVVDISVSRSDRIYLSYFQFLILA